MRAISFGIWQSFEIVYHTALLSKLFIMSFRDLFEVVKLSFKPKQQLAHYGNPSQDLPLPLGVLQTSEWDYLPLNVGPTPTYCHVQVSVNSEIRPRDVLFFFVFASFPPKMYKLHDPSDQTMASILFQHVNTFASAHTTRITLLFHLAERDQTEPHALLPTTFLSL